MSLPLGLAPGNTISNVRSVLEPGGPQTINLDLDDEADRPIGRDADTVSRSWNSTREAAVRIDVNRDFPVSLARRWGPTPPS